MFSCSNFSQFGIHYYTKVLINSFFVESFVSLSKAQKNSQNFFNFEPKRFHETQKFKHHKEKTRKKRPPCEDSKLKRITN